MQDKDLIEKIELYISVSEDVYIDRKPYIISDAHSKIQRTHYDTELEYYDDLIDYMISKL